MRNEKPSGLTAPTERSGSHTPGPWTSLLRNGSTEIVAGNGVIDIATVWTADKDARHANTLLIIASPALADALEETLAAMRALRGLAFTGSRIPTERYPEKQAADAADEKARAALRAAGRLPALSNPDQSSPPKAKE